MPSLFEMPITKLPGIGSEKAKLYHKLNIDSIGQLIRFYPRDYTDYTNLSRISDVRDGDKAVIRAYVLSPVTDTVLSGGRLLSKTVIGDGTGKLELVFFNNRYIKSMLKSEQEYYFTGKISFSQFTAQMISPSFSSDLPQSLRTVW